MKLFSSEFAHNYGTYSFGYCNYCKYEAGDSLSEIYNKGYLPYSGSSDVFDTFYMARSTRLYLKDWKPNSENRRVLRKHKDTFKRTKYIKRDFTISEDFKEFCLNYFKEHHGKHTMPKGRLEHILQEQALTHIVQYDVAGELAGYVFLAQDADITHIWFYFYAPEYSKNSFGMWVMLNEALEAQKDGQVYFYLGTAYGDKSRYKMNFSNLEFWDGAIWQQDKKNNEVKARIKNDHLDLVDSTDNFKKSKYNFF